MAALDVVDLAFGGIMVAEEVATLRRKRLVPIILVVLLMVSLVAGAVSLMDENQNSA